MWWAFWRKRSSTPPEPPRALPDDVGLPSTPRPPAAGTSDADDDDRRGQPAARTSGATPGSTPVSSPVPETPLTAPAADVDRSAFAAAGPEVAAQVTAGTPVEGRRTDERTLAVAATGALAARLPALSGVAGAAVFDEPEDELLHAYADLLAARAADRRSTHLDREDLLAVAHLAAAAAAVEGSADPALLLLAGLPPERQLQAAALLLAQTADDGGAAPDRLPAEVRELFRPPG